MKAVTGTPPDAGQDLVLVLECGGHPGALMRLTKAQMRAMYHDGYVVIRGAVPSVLVREARRAINHDLGASGMHPDELQTLRERSYCPELRATPVIMDLVRRSSIHSCAEQLLGEGNVEPVKHGYVVLRFPDPAECEPARLDGHFDGIGTGVNGVAKGRVKRSFTVMAVIYLSDVLQTYAGNFTVWPGSHFTIEAYFRRNGGQSTTVGMPRLDLPRDPVMIKGRAGDAVLCHHLLVHGPSPNISADIRYAVIFRMCHRDLPRVGADALTDMWREWLPLRRTAAD